jgi:glycosyltransferase involved in cell wall biosynthesis
LERAREAPKSNVPPDKVLLDMRVLQVNKFGWPKGGADVYMLRLATALSGISGIDVGVFAGSPIVVEETVRAFPAQIRDFWEQSGLARAGAASSVIWSHHAAVEIDQVLSEFRPDVVHLHNYAHQLSSSIVAMIRRRRIPMVMTAHDHKLICPAYLAVRKGADCYACSRHLNPVALRDKCLHDSLAWTATAFIESAVTRQGHHLPDVVIAPSPYLLRHLRSSWLASRVRLELVHNPAVASGVDWEGGGGYLLYVGRLSKEKGIASLLEWADACDVELVIAGDGPQRDELESSVRRSGQKARFTGHLDEQGLAKLRRSCAAQIVPSTVPENFPLAATEAAVDGVPLIVADRGGLPDLVRMGARGAIMSQASAAGLAEAVRVVGDGGGDLSRLRAALDLDGHCREVLAIYRSLCGDALDL